MSDSTRREHSNPLLTTTAARQFVGQHLLADLSDIAPSLLQDRDFLLTTLRRALLDAGCTILSEVSHAFPEPNCGVTGMFLLSESHAAFHTYPEHRYMALDLFVCGSVEPQRVLDDVGNALRCDRRAIRMMERSVELD